MTSLDLQDKLADEIRNILSDYTYQTPDGERRNINVYTQEIPHQETDGDEDPVPYLIVRINDGGSKNEAQKDGPNVVNLVIIIAIYDMSLDAQGHRDVMNIIDKIYERFAKNPLLKDAGVFNGNHSWKLQEDDYYPYYFGAYAMSFEIPSIRREDPYA